jgi:long-chain acyl-CoA synthetase
MTRMNLKEIDILGIEFATIPEMIKFQAQMRPGSCALMLNSYSRTYQQLDLQIERIAAAFRREGVHPRDVIAICAETSIEYVEVFLGALRAGITVVPLASSALKETLLGMISDSAPRMIFLDHVSSEILSEYCIAKDIGIVNIESENGLSDWVNDEVISTEVIDINPEHPFNIIYSSGTTGTPKGIVQTCMLRWLNVHRAFRNGYGQDSVVLLATPLYSNTTLATIFGAIALGSTIILMKKFSTVEYLEISQANRVTHTVLVPIQYQRILADPKFSEFDLTSFMMKFSTGAPFSEELKARVLQQWPGGLVEIYGMTEGGGACALEAHKFPNKLGTVGIPMPGNDIRVIDDHGVELAQGGIGEIVGHSRAMMIAYLNQPEKTTEVEWYDREGRRFLRTGDIGRFDEDGFLIVLDRKKDVIISGGFNIYSSDLEEVLMRHPSVREATVIGVKSDRWGETPVGFVILDQETIVSGDAISIWVNERLGKMQRLSAVHVVDNIPRNPTGKVLKRLLRELHEKMPLSA